MYYAVDESEDLQHHGIKGQKWGVRRFQNKDGSLTPAGRRRVNDNSSDDAQNGTKKKSGIDKKTAIKIALGTAAIAGAGVLAYKYATMPPEYKKILKDCAKVKMKELGAKSVEAAGKAGKKIANKFGERLDKVGDRMIDAALISVGGIAVAKINSKFAEKEGDTEGEKARKQVIRDTAKAGIETMAGGGSSNSNPNNKTWSDRTGTHAGKEITDKIGKPSNQNIDRSSKAWQDLFKDANGNQRDADTRATIKSLANAGYDINQIDQWLNHAEFAEWNETFVFSEFRW